MTNPDKLFGRLGNRMFQMAFCYAYAGKNGFDYYYQDPAFFSEYEYTMKKLFGSDIPPQTDQVAIHVRRGDYVRNDFYVDLMETDYYHKAMAEFPGADFLVFSDDIEWCKRQALFKDCEFSHETDEIADMNLMASCTGHIIANSSFSWWGAFISPYTQKVIAPSKNNWYADGYERTKCPDTWIRL